MKEQLRKVMFLFCISAMLALVESTTPAPHVSSDTNQGVNYFSSYFQTYMTERRYRAAVFGIVQDSKLLYSTGHGQVNGKTLDASSEMPIDDVSKVLTATAILQLVEKNEVSLNERVFGPTGILWNINPTPGQAINAQVAQITVDHLLKNTAGWDDDILLRNYPRHDPLAFRMGVNLQNFRQNVNSEVSWSHYSIIQFMLSRQLNFEPGNRVAAHCNFCYIVLGRIIEVISRGPYEKYIQENILEPAGMWRTHLGPSAEYQNSLQNTGDQEASTSTLQIAQPNSAEYQRKYQLSDASTGWFSTLYDIARLFVCVFNSTRYGSTSLLAPATVRNILHARNLSTLHHWHAVGMISSADGSLLIDTSIKGNNYNAFIHIKNPISTNSTQKSRIVLFMGHSAHHHRHIGSLATLPAVNATNDMFLQEPLEQGLLHSNSGTSLSKANIEADQLACFVNMMRFASYHPTWIHGYTDGLETSFLVLFDKTNDTNKLNFQLIISENKISLLQKISQHLSKGYHVSFLQSFDLATSTTSQKVAHVVKMTNPIGQGHMIQFDIDRPLENYFLDMQLAMPDGFYPVVQSVHNSGTTQVSYILQKQPSTSRHRANHAAATAFYDFTLAEFINTTRLMLNRNLSMAYVDTYQKDGESRFSVLYDPEPLTKPWVIVHDITPSELSNELQSWTLAGYKLHLIAAYKKNASTYFVGLWIQY